VGFFDRAVALVAALLVFAGFAAYLWFNLQSDDEEERETIQAFNADEIATIAATTVTEDQIKKQKDEILKAEKEKQRKEKLRQEQEKKKLADLKKKQAQEKKKLDDIKKKQAEEEKAIALKKKKAENVKPKKKLAKLKKMLSNSVKVTCKLKLKPNASKHWHNSQLGILLQLKIVMLL